ncbi:MAG TPA: acetate--CoA ligase family protein [Methylomirabilota bacterium]
MTPALAPFFEPRSVAIIGASRNPSKVGGSVLANLIAGGFTGRIVPVNVQAETVQGLRAIPSILAAAQPVDLAVITVPAAQVLAALKDCVARGVGGAIVISAGFRETNEEGREREAALRAWLAGQPIRVLGPNCLGWIRPGRRLNATFAPGMPLAGRIAFISHSGALAVAILDWSVARRMGFSLFASLGNQADLTETDLLRAAASDPETRVIAAYLEGVADGRRFYEALQEAAAVKPVVVLKTGRSAEGARAVSSHTGALAGSDRAFEAAVRQAGALRVESIEALFDVARALENQPLPRGRRLLVMTNGGGLGIVATDTARSAGLTVPVLDDAVQSRLRAVLPPMAGLTNPVDLVGDADAARFNDALHAVGPAGFADAALILMTAQAATDSAQVARAIVGGTRRWSIPVATAFVGGARVAPGAATLDEAGIPCYPFPERAVAALAGMAEVAERQRAPRVSPLHSTPPQAAPARDALRQLGAKQLGLLELAPLLQAYGLRVAAGRLATTPEAAALAAQTIGFPVALKVVSPDITHKTDVGGVSLGLGSGPAVIEAMAAMLERVRRARPEARLRGVLVQPMVAPGRELLLGAVRDPQFGPLIVVGFGGVYVETLKDTSARLAPVSAHEAAVMLDELRLAPLLGAVRGQPAVDRESLTDTISRFSAVAVDVPELTEIEINPLVASPEGVIAVDARATIAG